jgi:type IV secretory pathway VirB2 component (pilin)
LVNHSAKILVALVLAVVEEVKAEAASAEAVETPVEETPEVIETPVVAEEKIEAVK